MAQVSVGAAAAPAVRRRQEASLGAVVGICAVATFLDFLDVTVVNVAFPDLQRDFAGTSISVLSWVVTAYAVVFAALLTPAGRVADVLGRKRVFLVGTAGFALFSGLSAAAPSVPSLIAARTLQGGFAAVTIPAALGLVLAAAPEEKRTQAVGAWGATASISAAAGPTLGGLLIHAFDWRAVFVINIPLAVVTVLAGIRLLPDVRPNERRLPDVLGTLALAVGLGLAVVGLTKAGDWGWASVTTIAFLVSGALLVAAALLRARRHPAPAIETSLWRSKMFTSANVTSLLIGTALYAWMLVCVLFVVGIWHYSILQAGLAVSPAAFTSAVAAIFVGLAARDGGYRKFVFAGALIIIAGGIWLALEMGPDPNFLGFWLPCGLLVGIGFGAAMTGVSSAASMSVPVSRFAAGTGMNMTARQVGGALGVAVLATILSSQAISVGAFRDVFIFCTVAAGLAALASLRLTERS